MVPPLIVSPGINSHVCTVLSVCCVPIILYFYMTFVGLAIETATCRSLHLPFSFTISYINNCTTFYSFNSKTLPVVHVNGNSAIACSGSPLVGRAGASPPNRNKAAIIFLLYYLYPFRMSCPKSSTCFFFNALEQLPHDGNLSQLTSITVESASTEPPATNTPAPGPPVADTPATSEDP